MNGNINPAVDEYAAEAQERWGNTAAYKESCTKTAHYTADKWDEINTGMRNIFSGFAQCLARGEDPSDASVQTLVKEWQSFITENFYLCTNEILAGLGEMYSADPRFRENIDASGHGTAAFMTAAIRIFTTEV